MSSKKRKKVKQITPYSLRVGQTIFEYQETKDGVPIVEDDFYYTTALDRGNVKVIDILTVKHIYSDYDVFIKPDLQWEKSHRHLEHKEYEEANEEKNDQVYVKRRIRCHSNNLDRVINKYVICKAKRYNTTYTESRFKGMKDSKDSTFDQDKNEDDYTDTQLPTSKTQTEVRPNFFRDNFDGAF